MNQKFVGYLLFVVVVAFILAMKYLYFFICVCVCNLSKKSCVLEQVKANITRKGN